MPLKTSTTPLPGPFTNQNGVSNRLAASAKQASSIATSKWPIVGSAAYTKLARAGTSAGDAELSKLSPQIQRLCAARNAVWKASQAINGAITAANPQAGGSEATRELYNKLRGMADKLDKLVVEFPLEVR